MLQRGFENSQDLPVHVVLRGSQEKQSADGPAKIASPRRNRGQHLLIKSSCLFHVVKGKLLVFAAGFQCGSLLGGIQREVVHGR